MECVIGRDLRRQLPSRANQACGGAACGIPATPLKKGMTYREDNLDRMTNLLLGVPVVLALNICVRYRKVGDDSGPIRSKSRYGVKTVVGFDEDGRENSFGRGNHLGGSVLGSMFDIRIIF